MDSIPETERGQRYVVTLWYSSDEQRRDLYRVNEEDIVTKVLEHFNIPFVTEFLSDFHSHQPLLANVLKYGKDGKKYTLFSSSENFSSCEGERSVLRELESLGVIPFSVDDALKFVREKKNE